MLDFLCKFYFLSLVLGFIFRSVNLPFYKLGNKSEVATESCSLK